MRFNPKPLKDQVIIITGASSGIGLATARMAAQRGARLVLCSRNEEALQRVVNEIKARGGQAIHIVADVADAEAVEKISATAIKEFGGYDTWINNAGVTILGKSTDVPMEEKRRLFDVNFWGVVHGCRVACQHFRQKGGSIINVGSMLSNVTYPLQGIYSASKHAVKAYTDALRMELEYDHLPIAITLIKPGSINTPFFEHARNHLDTGKPQYPPPVYEPEVVAEAVLTCIENPRREIIIGGPGRLMGIMDELAPAPTQKLLETTMVKVQKKGQRPRQHDSLFFPPDEEGRIHGDYPGHVARSSLYTNAVLHPLKTAVVAFAFLSVIGGVLNLLVGPHKRRMLHE